MSGRHLKELERSERREAIALMLLRIAVAATLLLVAYYVLPAWRLTQDMPLLSLGISLLVTVAVLAWLVRRITSADLPELRAIEGLAIVVPLFLCVFAGLYFALSTASPASFSEPLSHTGALYFAVTVFSTVGFGDITPVDDVARVVVGVQMLLDLVLLGGLARVLLGAVKVGLSRGSGGSSGGD